MTSITIYRPTVDSPTGVVVHDVPLNKDAKVFRKLGGDYYVELSFSVDKTLALPKGSYIRVTDPTTEREEKYALKRDASPEPISGVNGYKYVLKFYSRQHDMEACQIKWLAGGSKELSFRVTTSLRGFAQLIADNMNAYLDSDIWAYDKSLDDTDMQEQAFEGVSCWDAINNIANAFGVEWWVDHGDQLTIRFGKCEKGDKTTDIREGEIVNRFPAPKRGDDSNYGTRFYIFGGTQNVPESYRSNNTTSGGTTFHISEKRIQLCEIYGVGDKVTKTYHPYYDAVEVPNGEIVEKTIILDDIFPKNETEIRAGDILKQDENIIEGQDPQPVYYIKVDDKPTLLSTLGIKFTTGALAGRSFDAAIVEKNNTCQIKIIHTTENSGGSSVIAVPNANLAPKAGDKYILTGVELDEDSITAAERELWDKGTELAHQRANDTNVYDCATDPVYCAKEEVKLNLDLGAKVKLVGAHFGEDGRNSRVQGYEKKLYNPYIATYNIGDNSVYSRTLKIYKELNATVTEAIVAGNKNITPTKGEKGDSGNYTEARYTIATSRSRKPTVDDPSKREPTSINDYLDTYEWTLEIPKVTDGEYLWKIEAAINGSDDTLLQNWSDPIRVTPINGDYIEYMYAVSQDANTPPDFVGVGTYPGNNWDDSFEDVLKSVEKNGGYIWQTAMKINGNTGKKAWTHWQTPIRITPTNGLNGVSVSKVKVEYAVSDSSSNAPDSGWSETTPTWVDGKFIWSRTTPVFSDSSPGKASAPVCLTGSKGATGSDGISISWLGELTSNPGFPEEGWAYYDKTAKKSFIYRNGTWNVMTQDGAPGASGDPGVSITKVDVEYAISNSNTTAPDESKWDTEAPDWVDGEYIWSRTKTTYSKGDPTYSEAVCITGGKGANGRGIDSIVEEYYSSKSATELVDGTWSETFPGWVDGRYIWTRSIITYTDGKTETTDPICVTGGKGETGDKGSRGPALRGPQDWNDIAVGYQFYSGADGEPFIDVVLYNGDHYLCKKTHRKILSSTYTPSDSSTYWTKSEKFDIIATKLLLSDYALIEKLGAGFIEMKDEDGEVVFKAENGDVECNSGTFNNITVGSGTIGGWNITKDGLINRDGNPLLSPNIRCVSKDNDAEASIGANARWESPRVVGYFQNNINQENKAIAVKILANSTATKNVAIDIPRGCIEGLAMSNEVVDGISKTMSIGCNHVIFTGEGGKSIILPTLSYSNDGYIVRITCTKAGYINIKTQKSAVTPNGDTCTQAIILSCITGSGNSVFVNGIAKEAFTGPASMEFVWVRDYPINGNQKGAWVLCMYSGLRYM